MQRLNVVEHRAKVGPAEPPDDKVLHELVDLADIGDPRIGLHARVALHDMHVDLGCIGFRLLQDVERVLDEATDQIAPYRSRRIDSNDELAHPIGLLVLERLDKGHVPVELHAVGVVDVVEFVLVEQHFLVHRHELAQKLRVVVHLAIRH